MFVPESDRHRVAIGLGGRFVVRRHIVGGACRAGTAFSKRWVASAR
jgi:hypothetical protein